MDLVNLHPNRWALKFDVENAEMTLVVAGKREKRVFKLDLSRYI